MYVTRPRSLYKKFPSSLSTPPDGPNSGFLVLQEESKNPNCLGLFKKLNLVGLPFPQNKKLTLRHEGFEDVFFIPVLDQPLSSNRYYVIHSNGFGEAYTCSKEEDKITCCFCSCVQEVVSRPLNPYNIYQQFEIVPYGPGGLCFYAKSVAPDGYPPYVLRRKPWDVDTNTPKNYELGEAPGLDTALRARLPKFNFPLSHKTSEAVAVGKWYCPFMFIKDDTLSYQMKASMFYEMTLEQKWEKIFECENNGSQGNEVSVDVSLQREVVFVAGREAVWDERKVVNKVIWFTGVGNVGERISLGLSLAIVERMKWEQERGGYGGGERQVTVKKVEEFGGMGGWIKFGCYVLVERFVLKRMNGSVVMVYDFKHIHQIKSKWE